LIEIDVTNLNFGPNKSAKFLKSLKNHTSIKILKFRGNNMKLKGWKIINKISNNLKELNLLDLSNNKIDNKGFSFIICSLKNILKIK